MFRMGVSVTRRPFFVAGPCKAPEILVAAITANGCAPNIREPLGVVCSETGGLIEERDTFVTGMRSADLKIKD